MSAETTIGIIGTGLIGGSIGLRARDRGYRVLGCDESDAANSEALRRGCVDEAVPRDELYARSDIVVLAMHVRGTLEELARLPSTASRACLIMDIASVKAPIVRAAVELKNFVATHPMAGAESSGPAAASAALFEGKPWLYVPAGAAQLDDRAAAFIAALGARAVAIDPEEHDATVAMTSHLPQVVATLFGRRVANAAVADVERYCGPVARELLRLSRSNPQMWREILETNSANVAKELRALASELQRIADSLQ
jgi:prephenate dehydrogenase